MNDLTHTSYYFPPLNGGEEMGFHDSLIYNFTGEILYHLARESIQNIVDAKDPKADGPAIAKFKLTRIPTGSIPDVNKLKEIFSACWRYEKSGNGEGTEFFKQAHDLINDKKPIYILEIGDYNTTGLYGDEDDRTGAYYKLMRISGSCNKDKNKGGSYGLGKGAYFRPSLFRTIFVSSIWGNNQSVFQGKLRLVSHNLDGELKQGIGFFAYPSIRNPKSIPETFRRTEKGTSIFIIGFEETRDWKRKMTESVLRYFWLAILEGELEVRIEDSVINSQNIDEAIKDHFKEEKIFHKDNPIPYYNAYMEGQIISKKLKTLGNVELRVFLQKDFPRRIEYFRNTGMVIQNKSHQSGKGFAGVFICNDVRGLLRKMEDPTHSKWSKDVPITTDPDEKRLYTEAENELKDFIEVSLDGLTASAETTTSTIKDLDKYFYSPADDEDTVGSGSPESIEGRIVNEETGSIIRGKEYAGKPPKINVRVTIPIYKPGEPGGNGHTGGNNGENGSGGSQPAHPEDEGSKLVKVNKNIKFRRMFVGQRRMYPEHIVFIVAEKGEKFDLEVRIGTEDSFDTVNIREADDQNGNKLLVERNYIKNIIIPDEGEMKMKIIFDEPGKYSLNLRAYESK